jgi:peptidyl-prolyl cis-trans isomerase C
MNGRTKSLAGLVGILALLVAISGLWAQTPVTPPAAANATAAVVNGEPIALRELDPAVDMIMKEKFKVQPPTETQRRQVRAEVLGMIINDLLMRQFLRKNGPKVEPVDVDKQLADFAKSLEEQKPPRTLQDFCRDTGQTEAQVRANISHMLQWLAYVKTHVQDEDIKAYYGQSKDFFDQVAVRASHIVFRVAPDAPETERKATREKLTALREEIVAGKIDFAEAAKKHSQCPSAPGGGDIGFFSRKGMLDENFAKAAYALKIGDVSDIVTTDFGLHLIKVTDRKPGQPSDFDKIKAEVRDFYVEEMRQSLLIQERKNAKIEINLP